MGTSTDIEDRRVLIDGYSRVVEKPEDGSGGTGVTRREPLCATFCGIDLKEHLINYAECRWIDWVDTFKAIANRRRSFRHKL